MNIVDAQVHIWGPDLPARPWPAAGAGGRTAKPQRELPLGAEELLARMDAAGVARTVLVPPSWEGERNDLALAAARRWPDRFAVMGRISPQAPEALTAMRRWKQNPGALGYRLLLGAGAEWATEREHPFWRAAHELDLPLMLAARGDLGLIARVAERWPELRIVVDHLAARHQRLDDAALIDFPALLGLARFPNVAVKASGLPCYSSQAYPWRNLHAPIRKAFEAFGPRRVFWGSDLSRLPCSYAEAIALFTRELDWLKGDDLAWVMGRGVMAWLGWAPRDAAP